MNLIKKLTNFKKLISFIKYYESLLLKKTFNISPKIQNLFVFVSK